MNDIGSLIDQFIATSIKQYSAYIANDYKLANKYFKVADRYVCEIKLQSNWVEEFMPLLEDDNINVRIRAASILLPYKTKRAEQVLKKCMLHSGIDGFNAKMILSEWRSGNLKFPVFENGKVVYK